MDISDEPTDRTVRATNRNAVREGLERDREYTATKTTTAMDKLANDGDRTATVSRCTDDRNITEDRRQMSSSDNPWLSASSQHFHPSTRTVPDSFAPPAFNGTNIDADTWLALSRRYSEYRQLADRDITQIFPLFLRWVILRGLRPWIKASIIAQKGDLKSVADILVGAVAESVSLDTDDGSADATKINQLMEDVRAGRDEVQQLNA